MSIQTKGSEQYLGIVRTQQAKAIIIFPIRRNQRDLHASNLHRAPKDLQ